MVPVSHFAYGWVNPVSAYAFSFLGSLLALIFTARAREATGRRRVWLLLMAAGTLGSTGIWLMHFVAMLGFDVPSLSMRYNVLDTVISLVLAVVVVGFGLLVVGLGRLSVWRILLGGPLTGVGVAGMHYTGMAAIDLPGVISYDRPLFVLSVVIAVVAATAALCLAMLVRSAWATVLAALAMGLAVSSMHYTGMAAVHVTATPEDVRPLTGASPFTLLVPIILLACLLICGLFYAMAGMSLNDQHNDLSRIAVNAEAVNSGVNRPTERRAIGHRARDSRAGDPRADARGADPRAGDRRGADPRAGDPWAHDPHSYDPRAGDPLAGQRPRDRGFAGFESPGRPAVHGQPVAPPPNGAPPQRGSIALQPPGRRSQI